MVELELIEKYGKKFTGISEVFPIEDWLDFITEDGVSLHTYKFPCDGCRAVSIFLHGVNAYSQNFAYLAKKLVGVGVEVVAFDMRGHEKSSGLRGFIPNAEVLSRDALDFLLEIKKLYGELPVFLLGIGIGGTLALKIREDVKGLILIDPDLGINKKIEGVYREVSRVFSMCMPTFRVFQASTCKVPIIARYIDENPYFCHGKTCVGTSSAILAAVKEARTHLNLVKCPVLTIQSEGNTSNNTQRVEEFMKNLEIQDKTLLMYPVSYYSMVFEDTITDISKKIAYWVLKRLKSHQT